MKNSLDETINDIRKILNITKKAAEKMFLNLFTENKIDNLLNKFNEAKSIFTECDICFYIKEDGICKSCMIPLEKNKICVVSDVIDAKNIIDKEVFNGTFHILKGEIDISKNINASKLKIKELFDRINTNDIEIILALNATFKGEVTSNYLLHELKDKKCNVTRLARGIPFGGVMNYVDKETFQNALKNRNKI